MSGGEREQCPGGGLLVSRKFVTVTCSVCGGWFGVTWDGRIAPHVAAPPSPSTNSREPE